MTERIQKVIKGRYYLHETLGQGGMGIVHRATDRLTGEIVAFKQVLLSSKLFDFNTIPHSKTESDLRLALAQEFQILAGLRHPHIVSVLDYGFDEEKLPYFTMTYIPEAQTILEAGKALSLEGKMALIQQFLQAIAYLHRRGILHRDLKPHNVLMSDNSVRVLDFGLADHTNNHSTSSAGTPFYAAPELWSNQPYTEAADLYAFGVIIYQLFTDRHPFAPLDHFFLDRVLENKPDLDRLNLNADLTQLIEQLLTALQNAATGQGSAWFIGGESGVGKSRLISELRIQALVHGFLVLQGVGIQEGGGQPYQLWRDLLRHLLLATSGIDNLTASILLPLVPDISTLLNKHVRSAPELENESHHQRLYSTITTLIAHQKQPILLILEDLQWAQVSLLPLPTLLRQVDTQSLMIVGTYRTDEAHEHLTNLINDSQNINPLSLSRLSMAEMADLGRAMLGDVGDHPEILAFLQRETEGNAFFATEVVRTLAEKAGQLDRIRSEALPSHIFTEHMQQILSRRLQRLPTKYQPLLRLAAIMGRRPDLDVLNHLSEGTVAIWLSAVHEAAIFTIQNNYWQFAHDKLREAVLARIPQEQVQQLHTAVATTIEHLYPDSPDQASILAHHWQWAGNQEREQACRYQAAQHAGQQYAHSEVLQHLERALALAVTDEQRYDALYLRERTHELLGNDQLQRHDLDQLIEISERLSQPAKVAAVVHRQASYAERHGDYEGAILFAQQAVTGAKQANMAHEAMKGYSTWGTSLMRLGNYAQAQSQIEAALNVARQLDDQIGIGAALLSLGIISYYQADYLHAEQLFQESLNHYQAGQWLLGMVRALNSLGVANYTRGAYDRAQEY